MDERQNAIEYLDSQLTLLYRQKDELLESLHRVEATITSLSQALDYLESDGAIEIEVEDHQDQIPKPDNLKLNRFKGQKLADIIVQVFEEADGLPFMKIEALTKAIYATSSEEEEKACRASLTAALHRMEKSGIVSRIDQGHYRLNQDSGISAKYKEINGRAKR